jgi:hypothetical protein
VIPVRSRSLDRAVNQEAGATEVRPLCRVLAHTGDESMCELSSESTSLPEPSGPTDEQFVYQLTEAGVKVLEEQPAPAITAAGEPQVQELRSAERARRVRGRDRRSGKVSSLQRGGAAAPVPYLRIAGEWLRQVGFDIGREYEVAIASGQLTIRVQS